MNGECPTCGTLARTLGYATTTAMYCAPFYDSDGVYHHHDYNSTTQTATCENGHAYSYSVPHTCSCGWSNE